jgi:hypothetical protein
LHCIKSPDQRSLITSLKVIILPLSKTKSESFMILFYGNPLNSARGYIQMAITIVVVIKNVCMSRHWKDELVAYGSHKQPSPRITHLMPLKHDHSHVCPVCPENVQHLVLTSKSCSYQTMHRNRPYE